MPAKRRSPRRLPDWADELTPEQRAVLVELEKKGSWLDDDETCVMPALRPAPRG